MSESDRAHFARVKRVMRESIAKFIEYRCHARVMNEKTFPLYRQCQRCYGYGRNGLYCHQHANKLENL